MTLILFMQEPVFLEVESLDTGRKNKPHRIYWSGILAHTFTHPVLQNPSKQIMKARTSHQSHLAN